MSRAANKAERLRQVEALLLAHSEGMKPAQIAKKLDVHRSTISGYIADLPGHIYIDDFDDGRWKIDRSNCLVNLRLSLNEAMALHLATRLLATRMDKQNPHAASALRQLGESLARVAPCISNHLQLSADVMDDEAQRHDPRYLDVLEKLTWAWAEGKRVTVWHRGKDGRVYDYDFAPYFIEPYAIGQTTHVIGVHGPNDKRITFKLERIERIEKSKQVYQIPLEFDPQEQLQDAWGIWYTDQQPVTVELKFRPQVARRVKETRWHRNEEIIEEPDGHLIWSTQVAEPQEMLPWIRGWGADVEVLAPLELCETLAGEARAMAQQYEWLYSSSPSKSSSSTLDNFFGE